MCWIFILLLSSRFARVRHGYTCVNSFYERNASAMWSGDVAYAKSDSMEPQRNRGRTISEPRNVATRNAVKGDAQKKM